MDANIEGQVAKEKNIATLIKQTDILINATPIGMYPNIDATPISKDLLHKELFVFDVIYNQWKQN